MYKYLIPTELLGLGLGLVLTESFIDHRPNDVVVLHCGLLQGPNPAVNVTMKITKMLFAGKAKHLFPKLKRRAHVVLTPTVTPLNYVF